MSRTKFTITWFVTWLFVIGWCVGGAHAAAPPTAAPDLKVLAIETFLADIAQNVAGERLTVESLIPIGLDPHSFEPTPGDVRRVAESQVLILHGAGMEEFLAPILEQAGGEQQIIEAAAGLAFRTPPAADSDLHEHGDPHFWLDPTRVITYVVNIRDGLSAADPDGALEYARNAAAYISQLESLDRWITEQVQQIPPEHRLLVTNHESFGYFADRYGFQVVGTVIPSVSTGASPSAQQMAQLIEHIRETGAPAIFLETGTNPQLAEQIAADAGVKVVTELFTHSITEADGVAPTYIAMMEYNTRAIVEALK